MHPVVLKHARISQPSKPQWNVSEMAKNIRIWCDKSNIHYFDFLKNGTQALTADRIASD